jgi:hypothetical protein
MEPVMKLTEVEFAERTAGVELSLAELAVLRKDVGLPLLPGMTVPEEDVYRKRIQAKAWAKLPIQG